MNRPHSNLLWESLAAVSLLLGFGHAALSQSPGSSEGSKPLPNILDPNWVPSPPSNSAAGADTKASPVTSPASAIGGTAPSVSPTAANIQSPSGSPDLSHLNLTALKDTKTLIPNLHLVTPFLLRGAQPSQQAFGLLRDSGVKTIVNLRNEPVLARREFEQVNALGMQYVNLPMDVFKRPPAEYIQKFIAVVNDPRNQPVYVHCLHGEDRTGTMCGIYRLTQQNWGFDKTYQEMIAYGFKPMFGQLTQTVYSYASDRNSKNAPTSYLVQDMQKKIKKYTK